MIRLRWTMAAAALGAAAAMASALIAGPARADEAACVGYLAGMKSDTSVVAADAAGACVRAVVPPGLARM
ncbi:hypothetical protein HUO13_32735 [Saccharopolyspora erythraea]|uniref:hypothetical protein n=1 Tax=Saccharopolyspora erythraea TaxID=1836 RepID=UPI001BA5223F|nr:hypothetical protein [Saccharopolyspora erythraea]QUH04912.1 hypothetical protein HUO13_32735 [Saccharopolyspora erythraea]